jgi:hypothetical protein
MAISTDPQVWIAAYLVIAYNSFFIKDTIFFRVALAMVLATSVGHWVTTSIYNINNQALSLLLAPNPDYLQILILIVGFMAFLRLTEKYGWMSRYPTSYLIGIGIATTSGPIIFMLRDQAVTLLRPFETSFVEPLIIILVVIASLTYFIIRRIELKGVIGQFWSLLTRIGRYLLFWGLGLVAADTVAGFFYYVYYGYEKVLWELLGL